MQKCDDFRSLLAMASQGDSEAIASLIQRYESQIRVVVRARLGLQLKSLLDSMDILQSVHKSLISGLQRGQYEIESSEKLIALAATIVRRKIARQWRMVKRENETVAHLESNPSEPEPDFSEQLASEEEAEQLLARLQPGDREILQLRLEGLNSSEAARKLGLSPGVVRVRLGRIRERLQRNSPIYPR